MSRSKYSSIVPLTGAFDYDLASFRKAMDQWFFDFSLANAIDQLTAQRKSWKRDLGTRRLLDAGAGIGLYSNAWEGAIGIDATPGIEELSEHRVLEMDLTKPHLIHDLGRFHWVTCLEVAEHIPAEHTDVLLDNLTQLATDGIICSWAPPDQEGEGHINCRTAEAVCELFQMRGWHESPLESIRLRQASELSWFRQNVIVFRPEIPKVFGVGLPKTGTTSLNAALNELGIRSSHWPVDKATSRQLQSGDYRLEILDWCDGLTDMQSAAFFRELDQTWPSSRFILTTRPVEEWLESIAAHFHRHQERFPPGSFPHWLRASMFGTPHFHKDRYAWVMEQHNAGVRQWFQKSGREHLLLEIALTEQGDTANWAQLASFLDMEIPQTPFPHSNYGLSS